MKDLGYEAHAHVLESWSRIQLIPDHELVLGTLLYTNLFKALPEAKILFGYSVDTDMESEEILKSKKFQAQARFYVQMFNQTFDMLGPDIDFVEEMLQRLQKTHRGYGVSAEMYQVMGRCLMKALAELLGPNVFTPAVQHSWEQIYKAITDDMV